ncbi:hypothetical protein SP15_022 [Bacillus phage SP-15]|uniref:Hint domain-containing protein n=1 Tax=Bacillus phage SP-15 TaxID=1792032 RepID=A0A127AYL6_9CAUD|nr:hypothetical protein SP15_022 [Bacillus phage SP-15]AMM44821.1 hypothetical protein SP15_022 [Bacillus phage SP-15]
MEDLIQILQSEDSQLAKLAADMGIDPKSMTEEERRVLIQILQEMATDGDSETLNSLFYADYDEVPVDIDTFIEDPEYFGNGTDQGKLIYPFWRKELRKIFAPGNKYFEVCLSGDTEVKLLDGRTLTMEQMLLEQISGTDKFYVYSYDMRLNKVTVGTAHSIMPTGIKPVYRITLDNGESFKATDNHKILMRDKSWKTVGQLSEGDSLMPFNWTYDGKGYEQISHPKKDGSSRTEPTHVMVKKWKYGGFAYNRKKKRTMHHRDFNKRNNDPRNLVATEHQAHIEYHSKVISQRLRDPEFQAKMTEGKRRKFKDPKHRERLRRTISEDWKNNYERRVAAVSGNNQEFMNSEEGKNLAKSNLKIFQDALKNGEDWAVEKHRKKSQEASRKRWSKDGVRSAVIRICRKLYDEDTEISESTYNSAKPHNMKNWKKLFSEGFFESESELITQVENYNHRVVSIEYVGEEVVYDMQVDSEHNFGLQCGAFVHNCVTGGIGLGKSTIAVIGLGYSLHKLLCLKNPQEYYGLTKSSIIGIAFFNITLD